jgi:ABC-type branched-subunit amino acid transport system ATPase component
MDESSGLSPDVVAEVGQIIDRIRAFRETVVEPKTNTNRTYHSLSAAISALKRASGTGLNG